MYIYIYIIIYSMCTPLVFQYDYSPVKTKWICTIVQHAVRRRCSICQCPLQAQMGGNHHPQMVGLLSSL